MNSVSFRTNEPFNHVSRALDLRSRMGFSLSAILAERSDARTFLVHVSFFPSASGSAENFIDRLNQMPNVHVDRNPADHRCARRLVGDGLPEGVGQYLPWKEMRHAIQG